MMTIQDDVRAGHREGLEAIRDKLAADLEDSPAGVSAQIAGQLRAVLAEIAALPAVEGKSARERLADRAAAADVAS